jgi:lipopolysaccharide biosynthesis regulator YciM
MVAEADALLGRLRARAGPGLDLATGSAKLIAPAATSPKPAGLPPYAVQGFLPYVFALYDAGRSDAADRLLAQLEAASPDFDAAKRIRVMLFGSPDERIAFLDSVAGASMASGDPDKIRAEAYQRLLAKDYGTAHDLYRHLQELEPNASTWGSGDWFNYGLASIETEAWADAETAMTNAIAAGASKPRALAHRARAKIMTGRIAEGIADAEAALAEEPKLRQACYALYLAYQKLGHQEKADEWLKRSKAP